MNKPGSHPPKKILPDGRIHRFATDDDPDDDAGWYVLHDDGLPAGAFGCFRSDLKQKWCAKADTTLTEQERRDYRKRIAAIQQQRDVEERRRHTEAARRAQMIWAEAEPASASHPYLLKKRCQPHGLRVSIDGRLIVPMQINNRLTSLQFIDQDGGKKFLPGGEIKGSSYTIGEPTEATPILLEAEGFSTAASLFEATGHPVVMAFYADNLTAVAQHLRQQLPTATILLCGDNDIHDDGRPNTGLNAATKAATAITGILVLPELDGQQCDFNDVHVQHGLDAVRTAIAAVVPRHILDEIYLFLGRFICYPSESAHVAHTLWIAHTHLMDKWESTPRLAFLSPEPSSGKTRALEISETLVPRPVEAMNVTPAYLFRKVSDPDGLPTVLFDEIDTLFGPRAKEHEEVRGMLNAGHRRGASAGRCVVRGRLIETEELPAFCAVALAGLGNLPDTILSRSVIIKMRRRAPGETVEPYRRRIHAPEGYQLRTRLTAWANQICETIDTYPVMPDGITDRNADIWESLLSIADAAGWSWPNRARVSAVTLVTDTQGASPSLGVRLLADLKIVFGETAAISTFELLSSLASLEETPWGDLKGKPLDARKLARFLHPYGISSKPIRLPTGVVKGYAKEDFYDAWSRYLPPDESVGSPPLASVTSVTSDTSNGELLFSEESPC